MSNAVTSPFTVFFDRSGQPLDNGYVYIGTAGINPEVSPITVYWDETLTTPATQPIRTLAGYPSQNGSPGNLSVRPERYSIVVRDRTGTLVYSDLNASNIGSSPPQFYLDDYFTTTWEAALDAAAAAASAAGGGIIYAYGREEYAFTAQPANLPAGVYVFGRPDFTRFKMPTTSTFALLRWGGSLSTGYTLAANMAQGEDSCTLTSVSGLTVGSLLRFTCVKAGLTLGLPTQLQRVEAIGPGNIVTLSTRAKFAVATADTYTLNLMAPCVGGGAYGIIFDGSANTAANCQGIYAQYGNGMFFDEIGGENMSGLDPTSGSTVAGVIWLEGCFDTRGLTRLWAYKSGCSSTCDIQFFGCGPAQYGAIRSEQATGFGPGWYNCTDQQVDSLYSAGARGRAGKAQCTYNFQLGTLTSDRPYLTGFSFAENASGSIGTAIYTPSKDLLRYGATIVRVANVSTITYASTADVPTSSPNIVTVSGATGADTFNGRVVVTQTGPTTWTYANTGVDETAGGTIIINNQANFSFWANDTGCVVSIGTIIFNGKSNANGDIHTGTTDRVSIGTVLSQGAFSLVYAGTAGSQPNSAGCRWIGRVNNATYVVAPSIVQALTSATGVAVMQGQDSFANNTWRFDDYGVFTPKAPATASAGFRWVTGAAPTAPVDGDMWREDNTLTGLKIRIAGVTRTVTIT